LVGVHATQLCSACHVNNNYALTSAACWNCHQADYNGAMSPPHLASGFPQDCTQCHGSSALNWTSATFNHASTGFSLTVFHLSKAGIALTRSHWHPERQFVFFENTVQLGTKISIYHDLEADKLAAGLTSTGSTAPRLARSFLTLRFQVNKALSFDFSHNYFRDVPTFDTRLLGTGLLDQFLFQGFSGGLKLAVTQGATFYGNLGSSKREQDPKASLNYQGGLMLTRLPIPFHVDLRYSKFNSSFGSGSYQSIMLTRQLSDKIRFDLQGGLQSLNSSFTNQSRTKYGTADLDYLIGMHYILGVGWTLYRGGTRNYDQIFISFGYRF